MFQIMLAVAIVPVITPPGKNGKPLVDTEYGLVRASHTCAQFITRAICVRPFGLGCCSCPWFPNLLHS